MLSGSNFEELRMRHAKILTRKLQCTPRLHVFAFSWFSLIMCHCLQYKRQECSRFFAPNKCGSTFGLKNLPPLKLNLHLVYFSTTYSGKPFHWDSIVLKCLDFWISPFIKRIRRSKFTMWSTSGKFLSYGTRQILMFVRRHKLKIFEFTPDLQSQVPKCKVGID